MWAGGYGGPPFSIYIRGQMEQWVCIFMTKYYRAVHSFLTT